MRRLNRIWPLEFTHRWLEVRKMMDGRPQAWADSLPEITLLEVQQERVQAWRLHDETSWADIVLFSRVCAEVRGRVLYVEGAWGENIAAYLDVLADELPQVAARFEAKYIEVEGRPGWAFLLKRMGFVVERVTMLAKVTPVTVQEK